MAPQPFAPQSTRTRASRPLVISSRTEVVDEFGSSLVDPVDEVSARLTTDVLRDLNEQVAHGESARTVASRWLGAQGLR